MNLKKQTCHFYLEWRGIELKQIPTKDEDEKKIEKIQKDIIIVYVEKYQNSQNCLWHTI